MKKDAMLQMSFPFHQLYECTRQNKINLFADLLLNFARDSLIEIRSTSVIMKTLIQIVKIIWLPRESYAMLHMCFGK